jgi:hypothetical protein
MSPVFGHTVRPGGNYRPGKYHKNDCGVSTRRLFLGFFLQKSTKKCPLDRFAAQMEIKRKRIVLEPISSNLE